MRSANRLNGAESLVEVARPADVAVRLDTYDRILIGLLQADGRASSEDLAKATGLSASTVRRRLERLIEHSAIKVVTVPFWPQLGLSLTALIGISVDLHLLREVGQQLSRMEEVVFVAIVTGSYDLIAEIVLPTNQDVVRFVTRRLAPVDGIRDIQTFLVPEFIKSLEQYRLPSEPSPLYLRDERGAYLYSEEDVPEPADS